jgi:hypothetical protein
VLETSLFSRVDFYTLNEKKNMILNLLTFVLVAVEWFGEPLGIFRTGSDIFPLIGHILIAARRSDW